MTDEEGKDTPPQLTPAQVLTLQVHVIRHSLPATSDPTFDTTIPFNSFELWDMVVGGLWQSTELTDLQRQNVKAQIGQLWSSRLRPLFMRSFNLLVSSKAIGGQSYYHVIGAACMEDAEDMVVRRHQNALNEYARVTNEMAIAVYQYGISDERLIAADCKMEAAFKVYHAEVTNALESKVCPMCGMRYLKSRKKCNTCQMLLVDWEYNESEER